jgi:hypothetical protein
VIFPLRFAGAARLYREDAPLIPVVLLEGWHEGDGLNQTAGTGTEGIYVYKTDIDADIKMAAVAAAALDMGKNGKIAVFLEAGIFDRARGAFLLALEGTESRLDAVFFTSYEGFSGIPDLSCVVLAGAGAEFFENYSDVPAVFLTWIDPALLPDDVVVVIDDSPWAQAVHAAGMVKARAASGEIKSKFEIVNKGRIDSVTLRELRKQF